jgi:elongator complex protein 3
LESDREDFERLWDDLCPDELKIYPTQLLANTELHEYWQRGEFTPYTSQELIDLITRIKLTIPRYCRVNRVIRDIPSTHVVEGNKRTSLRQDIQREMEQRGTRCQCIRCREIRGHKVGADDLQKQALVYTTTGAEEHFLSFITADDKLTGFLRLSLPKTTGEGYPDTGMGDLQNAAIIREVHIYGQSLEVGDQQDGAAQHTGLGTALINWSEEIARENGYARLAVISAVGTRQYYKGRGFERGKLYMVKEIT